VLLTLDFSEVLQPLIGVGAISIVSGKDGNLWYGMAGSLGSINATTHLINEYPTPTDDPFGVLRLTIGSDGNVWFTDYSGHIGTFNVTSHAFGEISLPNAQASPEHITTGPDGNIWFTEFSSNPAIGTIDINTHSVTEFPVPDGVEDITTGPDGNLWFTGGEGIGTINPTTHAVNEYPLSNPYAGPQLIVAGPDGKLWFNEVPLESAPMIASIDPTTHAIEEYPGGGNLPEITIGPDGNLWYGGSVFNLTTHVESISIGLGVGSSGITLGPDDKLWFTSGTTIGTFDPSTKSLAEFPFRTSGSFPAFYSTVAAPDGNLWVQPSGSSYPSVLDFFNVSTYTLTPVNTYPTIINSFTIGPDGKLWITDDGNLGSVVVLNSQTHAITAYPLPGPDIGQPGQIITGPDGNLWFTERKNETTAAALGTINPTTHEIHEFPLPVIAGDPLGDVGNLVSIAAGPDGNIWFAVNDPEISETKIGTLNLSTHAITEYQVPGILPNLSSLVAGSDGNMWFTVFDGASTSIGMFNIATQAFNAYPLPAGYREPGSLTSGPDGDLWFQDSDGAGDSNIGVINPVTHAVTENPLPAGITQGTGTTNLTFTKDGNLWITTPDSELRSGLTVAHLSATPLAFAAPLLAPPDDSGISSSDGVTQDNGTATAPLFFTENIATPGDAYVRLFANGNLIAGPVQTSLGTISIPIQGSQPWPDGTYLITATEAATASGPQSAPSLATTVQVDTAFSVVATSPANESTQTALPNGVATILLNHPISGLADGATFPMDVPNQTDAAAGTYVDGLYFGVHGIFTYHINGDGTASILLTPTAPLTASSYVIRIGSNFVDLGGNPLSAPGQIAAFTISSGQGMTGPGGGSTGSVGTLPPPSLPGPVVSSFQAVQHKGMISAVVVVFNESLDRSSIANSANFLLVDAGNDHIFGTKDDKTIALMGISATSPNTVTITLKKPLSASHSVRLTLIGQTPTGLRNTSGRLLDAPSTGGIGSNVVEYFGRPARAPKNPPKSGRKQHR